MKATSALGLVPEHLLPHDVFLTSASQLQMSRPMLPAAWLGPRADLRRATAGGCKEEKDR
jgi:hypothetical protein